MNSQMFTINWKDLAKGLVMAVIGGALLPIFAMIQSPGFDIATINIHALLVLAGNGAAVGFVGYIIKNYFSNEQGQVFGKIG